MIKLAVSGALGRMGSRIIALALEGRDFQIVAAIERKGHPDIGKASCRGLKVSFG